MDLVERIKKYLELCYRYLAIRNRSEKEIRDYLIRKKAADEIIDEIITRLKKQKFLDDEVFARGWIISRARFRPKGKSAIKFELLKKGVAKEIIEKVMSEKIEDLPDELTQAKNLIGRRIEKLKDAPRQEIYNKVGSFLARRGFNWETIKKAIDSLL
jgi:regulatory protein